MKMINVKNFEDGFEEEKPYEDNAQSSNYIKYKSFPSKFRRCREKSISELQFSLQQQIENINDIKKSVQHTLIDQNKPSERRNLAKVKAKNSKNESNRRLKRSKSSFSKKKIMTRTKSKVKLGRHKRSKYGSRSSANLRSQSQQDKSQQDKSQGKRIEFAIPFEGIFMQDEPIEYDFKSEIPRLTEQESVKIIQKWWRSMILRRKAELTPNLEKSEVREHKVLKRKKVKHSFSFGMDPNYTNITNNSNNSNAMFG